MQRQHGGCRPTFPRHLGNALLDLRALRLEIGRLEGALDARIGLAMHDIDSHERALDRQSMPMCRQYTRSDPSHAQLLGMAAQTMTAAGGETAAVGV